MMKYIGIIKLSTEYAIGVNIRIITRFSNSKDYLRNWMRLYHQGEKVILTNTEALQSIFAEFVDRTPITDEEKEESRNVQKINESIMKNEL